MVSLTTTVERVDGVTFVSLYLENPDRARTVRVVNRLDGPCWPPRRQGRPAEGWDEGGYEGVVAAESTLALGYASPAPPGDTPAEIEAVGPAPEGASDGDAVLDTDTPESVLRSLGDPVVPREAVPVDVASADTESRRVMETGESTGESTTASSTSNGERHGDRGGKTGGGTARDRKGRQHTARDRTARADTARDEHGGGWSGVAPATGTQATPGRRPRGDAGNEPDGADDRSVADRLAAIERRLAALESR